jgi:hypothetical protein
MTKRGQRSPAKVAERKQKQRARQKSKYERERVFKPKGSKVRVVNFTNLSTQFWGPQIRYTLHLHYVRQFVCVYVYFQTNNALISDGNKIKEFQTGGRKKMLNRLGKTGKFHWSMNGSKVSTTCFLFFFSFF